MTREKYLESRQNLLNEAETFLNEGSIENYEAKEAEIKELDSKFDAISKAQANINALKESQPKVNKEMKFPAEARNSEPVKKFKNLAEQLSAIKDQATTGVMDSRLMEIQNHSRMNSLGLNTDVGSDGGFAIQTDFAGLIMESAAKAGDILPKVDRYTVSDKSNRVEWTQIKETDVSEHVYGGIQMYWKGEEEEATASKPQLEEKDLKLVKLTGLAYATHEFETHSDFASQLYSKAFELGVQRKLEAAIIAGNGVGQPLGFQNGGDTVTIAKETSQAAETVLYDNIVKMYNRAIDKKNSSWILHPDVQEQLDFLSFPVGTGGVPVYLPSSSQGTLATLKGREIIESDHCAALGTVGDINLMNLNEYMLIMKGGMYQDYSIHVEFVKAVNAFRFIVYANGMPKRSNNLTIKNSSNARSNCVKLATRA